MSHAVRIESCSNERPVSEELRAAAADLAERARILVCGRALATALGYSSTEQLAKASERDRLPVAIERRANGTRHTLEADGRALLAWINRLESDEAIGGDELCELLHVESEAGLLNIWRRGVAPLWRLEDGRVVMLRADAQADSRREQRARRRSYARG